MRLPLLAVCVVFAACQRNSGAAVAAADASTLSTGGPAVASQPSVRPARSGESLGLSFSRLGPPRDVGEMIAVDPVYLSGVRGETDRVVPRRGLTWFAEPADAAAFAVRDFMVLLRPGPMRLFATYGDKGELPIRSNTLALDVGLGPSGASPVSFWIGRTGCLGRCPVYTVWVCDDGSVEYRGNAHVKLEGRQFGRLEASKLQALKAEFAQAGFASIESDGPGGLDLPSAILVQRQGGAAHGVQFFLGPSPLVELAASLEKALEVERWIGTTAERDALPGLDSEALKDVLGSGGQDLDAALKAVLGNDLPAKPSKPAPRPVPAKKPR